MESFRQALAAGAECVELDVHLSADGVPVVMHDPTLDRTTDATGAVAELSARADSRRRRGRTIHARRPNVSLPRSRATRADVRGSAPRARRRAAADRDQDEPRVGGDTSPHRAVRRRSRGACRIVRRQGARAVPWLAASPIGASSADVSAAAPSHRDEAPRRGRCPIPSCASRRGFAACACRSRRWFA